MMAVLVESVWKYNCGGSSGSDDRNNSLDSVECVILYSSTLSGLEAYKTLLLVNKHYISKPAGC